MWIFRAFAQFKESELPPGFFQDFEDGCINFLKLPIMLKVEHGVVVMTVVFQ